MHIIIRREQRISINDKNMNNIQHSGSIIRTLMERKWERKRENELLKRELWIIFGERLINWSAISKKSANEKCQNELNVTFLKFPTIFLSRKLSVIFSFRLKCYVTMSWWSNLTFWLFCLLFGSSSVLRRSVCLGHYFNFVFVIFSMWSAHPDMNLWNKSPVL